MQELVVIMASPLPPGLLLEDSCVCCSLDRLFILPFKQEEQPQGVWVVGMPHVFFCCLADVSCL